MLQLVQDPRTGDVEVVEVPDPWPGKGEILVRNAWSLISPGTEQTFTRTLNKGLIRKAWDRPPEVRRLLDQARHEGIGSVTAAMRARFADVGTPGYSSSGTVEQVGDGAKALQPGDLVACVGANSACHAELVVVPAPLCIPLPGNLDPRWGAFAALGGVAAHGTRVAEVHAGAYVAVIGLGLIGQLTTQLVAAAGARPIGTDLIEERVDLARRLGATVGATIGIDDVEAAVSSATQGQGVDSVIITAGSMGSEPIELAARIARDRAIVSVVGNVRLELSRTAFYAKELQLRVSRSYGPGRYDPLYEQLGYDYPIGYVRWTERRLIQYVLEEVAAGRVKLEELVTHEFPVDRGTDAYAALDDPSRLGILLRYPTEAPPPRRARAQVGRPPAPSRSRLGVGLVGPGRFARTALLPELRRLDVELVGVAGKTPARATSVARRWGARYAASVAEEILFDDAIDVVIIATRHDSHADLAATALEQGKAVFLEKPLAIDQAGLTRLVPLLEGGGRLVVDFNRGFAPTTRRLADWLKTRSDPIHIHYRVNAEYLPPDHWLRDPRVGGGRLVGEGCHFVDLCSLLVGDPVETLHVSALGEGPSTLSTDNFVLELRYEDGSVATIAYVASGAARLAKEHLEVMGGGKAAILDDFRRMTSYEATSSRQPALGWLARRNKGHADILAAAMAFFREGGPPPIPYERILETTAVTLVARSELQTPTGGTLKLTTPGS